MAYDVHFVSSLDNVANGHHVVSRCQYLCHLESLAEPCESRLSNEVDGTCTNLRMSSRRVWC